MAVGGVVAEDLIFGSLINFGIGGQQFWLGTARAGDSLSGVWPADDWGIPSSSLALNIRGE